MSCVGTFPVKQHITAMNFVLQTKRKLVWLLLKMILFVCISIPGLIASLPIMVTVRCVAVSFRTDAWV